MILAKADTAKPNSIKVQSFSSWLPQTGGRVTPITYGKLKPEEGGGTMAWRFLRVRDFDDVKAKPVNALPKAIDEARQSFPDRRLIGAHLMAPAFGGPDRNPKNLTILTAISLKQLKAFDKNIINGFRQLLAAYEVLCAMGLPPQEAVLTVMIKVRAKGEWDKEFPGKILSTHLTCKAELEGTSEVDRAIEALSPEPPVKLISEYEGLVNRAEIQFMTARKMVDNK